MPVQLNVSEFVQFNEITLFLVYFPLLMSTHWFNETVDLYFESDYEGKYNQIMSSFFNRGVIKKKNDKLYATVKP
jgi:hypothetical protein